MLRQQRRARAVAQRVLGHAWPEMTAKVYTHLGLEDLRGAVERD